MKQAPLHPEFPRRGSGFTLIEILVSIGIIALLALFAFVGTTGYIEKGRKSKASAQFRDFKVGLSLFEADYQKPPIPKSKRDTGWDTIYGDPGGFYSNDFLVAALAGEDRDYPYVGESFATRDVNPLQQCYMKFPFAADKKSGVGDDGILYDPWGREVMVAINGFESVNSPGSLSEFSGGQNDKRLYTWGLAEYTDTKPRSESYVFWSYGKDGEKGKNGESVSSIVPLRGSDDVVSW